MSNAINYKNNPLNGVGLKQLLNELVDHYGFEILFAYLNINCFKNKPSVESSAKFLKKTDWAREKVESFYLYKFKNLPRASSEQFSLPPRVRIIPDDQTPGAPAELSLEDAERLRQHREKKAAERDQEAGGRFDAGGRYRNQRGKPATNRNAKPERESGDAPSAPAADDNDPWGNWKS